MNNQPANPTQANIPSERLRLINAFFADIKSHKEKKGVGITAIGILSRYKKDWSPQEDLSPQEIKYLASLLQSIGLRDIATSLVAEHQKQNDNNHETILEKKELVVVDQTVPNIFQDLSGFGSIENDILKETKGYISQNIVQIRGLETGTIGTKIINIATGLVIAKGVQEYYQDNDIEKYEKYFDLAKEIRDFYKKKNLEPGVIGKIYLGELNVENLNLADFLDIGQRFKEMEQGKIAKNLNSHKDTPKSTENTPQRF